MVEGWYSGAPADPTEVAAAAKELSAAYLECREARKHWYRPRTVRWLARQGCYEEVKRCGVCKAVERTRWLSESGHILYSHLEYIKPDYLLHVGGRVDKDGMAAIRREGILRMGAVDVFYEDEEEGVVA